MSAPDPHGSHTKLELAFTAFEARFTEKMENLVHDMKGILQSLGAYATNRDLAATEARLEDRRAADAREHAVARQADRDRLERLEKTQTGIMRALAGAALTALVSGATYIVSLVLKGAHP